jgi:hypothetical protein
MDSRKLPGRALVDSGVVTRSMGDLAPDDATEVCKGFYEAMLAFGREILIAAPTIAEVMRKDGLRALPRTNGIEVVAFDDQAALVLGKTFPMDVIKSLNHSGTSRSYLLYDALIVACGIRTAQNASSRSTQTSSGFVRPSGSAVVLPATS